MQQYDLQGNVYDIQINTSHEKTAKEMFEALGYKQVLQYDEDDKEDLIGIRYKLGDYVEIIFDLWDFDVTKFGKIWEHLGNSSIDMEELKAINQQCKELKWLDE